MLVVKDSSANKCGVVCSSYEILAAHLLSRSAFEAQKGVIVAEVLERLRALASLEADLLFKEYSRFPGALPDFSRRISEAINLVADAIIATASDDQVTALFQELAPEHLPPTLAHSLSSRRKGSRPVTRAPAPGPSSRRASSTARASRTWKPSARILRASRRPRRRTSGRSATCRNSKKRCRFLLDEAV